MKTAGSRFLFFLVSRSLHSKSSMTETLKDRFQKRYATILEEGTIFTPEERALPI